MPHNSIKKRMSIQDNDYDSRIADIISALDYLRGEAKLSGNDDIYNLIDSTFTICLHTFCIIKRYELQRALTKI